MARLWHPHGVDANASASMTQRSKYFFVFLSAFAVFAMGLSLGSEARGQIQSKADAKTISLGMISEINRARVEDHFHDFVNYVARRITPGTRVEGKVVLAATPFQLVKLLEQKRVDFFLESPYPTYIIDYVHGAGKPILRRWKSGMAEYQSLIFTRAGGTSGSKICAATRSLSRTPARLRVICCRNPFSCAAASSSWKSRASIRTLADRSALRVRLFAEKLFELVLTKQAAAGAISNDDLATLDAKTKRIHRSGAHREAAATPGFGSRRSGAGARGAHRKNFARHA